jgi:AcrR family transcriptional regulator
VDAGDVDAGKRRPAYPRATGSARGQARRRDLLERVTDDLAANGLVDFSLRRAARAAGTTHKVLLYHFDGVEDLLGQAMYRLRERRIDNVLTAATGGSRRQSLASRVRALWPALADDASGLRVIDQAIGLAMYDPERYAHLAREASAQYRPALLAMCPEEWPDRRKREIVEMILATMRGFLMEWRTSHDAAAIEAGLAALARALKHEEADAGNAVDNK